MKANLNLSVENIGDIVYVKTEDGFSWEGPLMAFTDKNMQIKDPKTQNVFTIFFFEIKEFEVTLGKGGVIQPIVENNINQTVTSEKTRIHPTFGKIPTSNNFIEFCEIAEFDKEFYRASVGSIDLLLCKFVVVTTINDNYEEFIDYLFTRESIGISFYLNDSSLTDNDFKYFVLSCERFTMIIDLRNVSPDDFRVTFARLAQILTSEQHIKIVYNASNVFHFIRNILQIELVNFIDLQIMHFGLHNIRMAEALKSPMTYLAIVELLFGVSFKLKSKGYFTEEDVIWKMAFNTHFLLPMFHIMLTRLIDPVRFLSKRICDLDTETDFLSSINLSKSSNVNFDLLPRSIQFWNYRDNSQTLQAKKKVAIEFQHERSNPTAKEYSVVEIKKNLIDIEETTQPSTRAYIEDISESSGDEENHQTNTSIQSKHRSSKIWSVETDHNIRSKTPPRLLEPSPIKSIGRGRGNLRFSYGNEPKLNSPFSGSVDDERQLNEKFEPLPVYNSDEHIQQLDYYDRKQQLFASSSSGSVSPLQQFQTADNDNSDKARIFCPSTSGSEDFVMLDREQPSSLKVGDKANPIEVSSNSSSSPLRYSCPLETKKPLKNNETSFVIGRGRGRSFNQPKFEEDVATATEIHLEEKSDVFVDDGSLEEETIAKTNEEFCELSVNHWTKKMSGTLSVSKFKEKSPTKPKEEPKNPCESLGIVWDENGSLNYDRMTDDLYKEFGL